MNAIVDRTYLRLSAAFLAAGVLLSFLAGYFHADREIANNHSATFLDYAGSAVWTLAHLGQFAGMAVMLGGLLTLPMAVDSPARNARWISRCSTICSNSALVL